MRAVLFCLVVSANALPEAHLRGRVKDHLRDRDLSVPEDAKNHYANTDASSDEISATSLEEGGFGLGLRRLLGLASIKGTLSHEGASKDIKSKAETAYATGGHARPVLETEVSPRDQDKVSQHTTQGADAALAELADAPQTITSEAVAFDDKSLSGSTERNAAAEMIKSRLATQTTRPAFEQGFAGPRRLDESLCRNDNENCEFWAELGECEANPGYMLVSCSAACGCTEAREFAASGHLRSAPRRRPRTTRRRPRFRCLGPYSGSALPAPIPLGPGGTCT